MESARGSSSNPSHLEGLEQFEKSENLFKKLTVRNIMKTTNDFISEMNNGEESDENSF